MGITHVKSEKKREEFHEEPVSDKIEYDCKSDLVKGHASRPYKSTGKHLLLINWRVTSSEATRPIFENTVLIVILQYKAVGSEPWWLIGSMIRDDAVADCRQFVSAIVAYGHCEACCCCCWRWWSDASEKPSISWSHHLQFSSFSSRPRGIWNRRTNGEIWLQPILHMHSAKSKPKTKYTVFLAPKCLLPVIHRDNVILFNRISVHSFTKRECGLL